MNRYLKMFFNVLRNVAIPFCNFLTQLVGIRIYGKENWGQFISISIWIYFIVFIAKWAGQNYIIKEFSQKPSEIFTIFFSNFIERSFFLLLSFFFFFLFPSKIAIASIVLLLLIHFYSSFDALIIYHQKFHIQFITEIMGVLIIIGYLISCPKFDLQLLIYLFSLSFLVKTIILMIQFNLPFKKFELQFSTENLYSSFPFFLIGFSGWLSSKIDVYVVSYYFSKEELSRYQLLITAFSMLQTFSVYLITPFNKHLFRLPKNIIKKINTKMAIVAFPIVIMATIFIWLILEKISHFSFPFYFYLAGGFSAIPMFYYIIDIMQLYRNNKEKSIVKVSFTLIFINLILMVFLIPFLGLFGVLFSVCLSQWLFLLIIKFKKIINPMKKKSEAAILNVNKI